MVKRSHLEVELNRCMAVALAALAGLCAASLLVRSAFYLALYTSDATSALLQPNGSAELPRSGDGPLAAGAVPAHALSRGNHGGQVPAVYLRGRRGRLQ